MNIWQLIGMKDPKALQNAPMSPVDKQSVIPLVQQPQYLQNAPQASTSAVAPTVPTSSQSVPTASTDSPVVDTSWNNNKALGEALMGFGKGLLSTSHWNSPLAKGVLGASEGYAKGMGDVDETKFRGELEAAYKTGNLEDITKARAAYMALPNYKKEVVASLEDNRKEGITGTKLDDGWYVGKDGVEIYRDPEGSLGYQTEKAEVDSKIKEKEADTAMERTIRINRDIEEADWEIWKQKNPIEFQQDMERLKAQGNNQMAVADRAASNQDAANTNQEIRAENSKLEKEALDEEAFATKWDGGNQQRENFQTALANWSDADASKFDTLIAQAGTKDPTGKIEVLAALATDPVLQSKFNVIDGAATALGIEGMRGLGAMTIGELQNSKHIVFNPSSNAQGNMQLWDNYVTAGAGRASNSKARAEELRDRKQTQVTRSQSTGTSDSGASMSGGMRYNPATGQVE